MPTLYKLKRTVEDNTTKNGKRFDWIVQALIAISLISFTIETLPSTSKTLQWYLEIIEGVTVCLFTIEFVLRLIVANNKWGYLTSFYGIIDLLAIAPFYITTGLDLRMLRAFRVFRVFRTLKLIRYNKALRRFGRAWIIIKEEMVLFFFVTAILIFLSASGIYFFENPAQPNVFKSVPHSLWWAMVTLTTVGYGDVYPITAGGRVFTSFVLVLGVGVVTVPAGLIASALSKARELEEEEDLKMKNHEHIK